mmetsp:Transcript_4725/g.8536  ORF Transcript_4725/g.8536 Transcript_4725/m.8536 type:complete len:502 (-) Transcript_4725:255-1760(-)
MSTLECCRAIQRLGVDDVLQILHDFKQVDEDKSGLLSLSILQDLEPDYAIDRVTFESLDKDQDGVISVTDAMVHWFPNIPRNVLDRLFATSLDLKTMQNLTKCFCRLTNQDEPNGILSVKKLAKNEMKFLGVRIPVDKERTQGWTLPELAAIIFPSLHPTVIQQYVGSEISEKRWRQMKAGFDALIEGHESIGVPLQLLLQRHRKNDGFHDLLLRWHNHLVLGGVYLDPSPLAALSADDTGPIPWPVFVKALHPSVPRHRMARYFKSYNINGLDRIVPDSPEKLLRIQNRVTTHGLPMYRLQKHPHYQPPSAKRLDEDELEDSLARLLQKGEGMRMRERSDWRLGKFEPLHPPRPLTEEQMEDSIGRLFYQSMDNSATILKGVEDKILEDEAVVLKRHQFSFESTDELQDSVRRLFTADVNKRRENAESQRAKYLYYPQTTKLPPEKITESLDKLKVYQKDKEEYRQRLQDKYTVGSLPVFKKLTAAQTKESAHRLFANTQ